MEILTVAEAAEYLRCSKAVVERRLAEFGAFDLAMPGAGKRLIRIPKAGIDQFIRANAEQPTKATEKRRQDNGPKFLQKRKDK